MVGPVIFDTIKRYLMYSGYDVTWVVNITDVDDKLIQQQHERGVPMADIAEEMKTSKPTVSRIAKRMMKAGKIRRRAAEVSTKPPAW